MFDKVMNGFLQFLGIIMVGYDKGR